MLSTATAAPSSGTASMQMTPSRLLQSGVNAVLNDDGFKSKSAAASRALKAAEELSPWLLQSENQLTVGAFATQLTTSLQKCFVMGSHSEKLRREKMWGQYQKLRISDMFKREWQDLLEKATSTPCCPIFYQYVTDFVFREMIKQQYPIERVRNTESEVFLTTDEMNALRYAAGYVPRALRGKLRKSANPLKDELTLCLLDLLDDGDEEHDGSCNWIQMIDRGGLTHVNNVTYNAFLSMELELRRHLTREQPPNFRDVAENIKKNEDVQFSWSMVAADWEEEEAQALLALTVGSNSLCEATERRQRNDGYYSRRVWQKQRGMGRRKFRLSVHRKNAERKKQKEQDVTALIDMDHLTDLSSCLLEEPECVVSLPISAYTTGEVSSIQCLQTRISAISLPTLWIDASNDSSAPHLSICKLVRHQPTAQVEVTFTLSIDESFGWRLSLFSHSLDPSTCGSLCNTPLSLRTVDQVLQLLATLDSVKICIGNPEKRFIDLATCRALLPCGESSVYIDKSSGPTVRSLSCDLLVSDRSRCSGCTRNRASLSKQLKRNSSANLADRTLPSSHANLSFLSPSQLVTRLQLTHQQLRLSSKQLNRLKAKITSVTETMGVQLDEEVHKGLQQIMAAESKRMAESLPNSFQKLFWQQQNEAASKSSAKGMRWHPLMIKWCLYLRHRSSGAYDLLRESGCLKLPSQRTLRDYTHFVKAATGFSTEVDEMIAQAANIDECEEYQRYVLLILDEMHIREDLVYDKYSGELVGFTNLGDINRHLVDFEQSISGDRQPSQPLASTMMVFMLRGLFTKLQFAYAQFPCGSITGDLLFGPLWEAVYRLERRGFKVMGATLDGNAVNRRLIKIHDLRSDLLYKVANPYTADGRQFYFFSDPPHLIKTVRNCWSSKNRQLWCNGKKIQWRHLLELYERDRKGGVGLCLLPKLKYEHINLSSFSKMRVDLAAQVLSESVAKALRLTGGSEVNETARLAEMMDKFFDALNVSNYTDGIHKLKGFKHPYRSAQDFRLKWLEEEFLGFLDEWETSVKNRPEFSKSEKKTMLLSPATMLGLRITAKSFVELVRHLFTVPGVKTFLSQRICQDPLEKFLHNTQALRVINSFCKDPARGNCRGGSKRGLDLEQENRPLPKRPRRGQNIPRC